jgi:Domain of unknown function (DUF4388)
MPDQYLSTSRLANVIQLIALGRQTGILRVIRGHGATREMGQIQFVDGQPSAALLGHLTGTAALNVLNNWGESYYAFEDGGVGDDGIPEPSYGQAQGTAFGAGHGGGDAQWGARPSATPTGAGGATPGPTGTSWPSYSPFPSPNSPPRPPSPGSMPPGGQGSTGALPGRPSPQTGASLSYPSGPQPALPGSAVGARAPLPRRTSRVDLSEPLPLDRRERMILLLIDGRRGVDDLARLTRRTNDEVRAVLGNLKMLGLIE